MKRPDTSPAFGERVGSDDAVWVFGEEGRDAAHARAQRAEGRDRRFVSEFVRAEDFGCATECAAQAVERKVAFGKDFAARLKFSERVEHDALGVRAAL